MTRNALEIPDEYTAALSERLGFDLGPESLVTRTGKAYIAQKAEIVSRISRGLTTNRVQFLASDYLRQKEIRDAYTLYYMTTNLLKMHQPLRELSLSGFFEQESSLRVLDLGTGTGAATWGMLSYLHEEQKSMPSEMTLTDSIGENLQEAEHFSRYFLPHLSALSKPVFSIFDLRQPASIPEQIKKTAPYNLITMMNVLNELNEEQDMELLESIMSLLGEDGALVLIEPATRNESRRLLRFRDLAVQQRRTVYSPCTRQDGCPALTNEDNWCHTDIAWKRPAFIKAIDDIAGTLRLSLKSTYLILRKDGITINNALRQNNLYRIVSERFDEKGRIRAFSCGENGRYEHIINKRDLAENNKDFSKIERYDVVTLTETEVREHDIRLLKESECHIVLPVLGAR